MSSEQFAGLRRVGERVAEEVNRRAFLALLGGDEMKLGDVMDRMMTLAVQKLDKSGPTDEYVLLSAAISQLQRLQKLDKGDECQ